MWAYDDPDENSWQAEQERTAQYLRDNPEVESTLWTEWVCVVCDWDKTLHPTQEEWAFLRSKFYSGKAPIDSFAELKKLRGIK